MGCVSSVTCKVISHDLQEEDIRTLKSDWTVLIDNVDSFGVQVFTEILIYKEIKDLFPFRNLEGEMLLKDPHFTGHAARFARAISTCIRNMNFLEQKVAPLLYELGKTHVNYPGIRTMYFKENGLFVTALLSGVQTALGSRFEMDNRKAWEKLFNFIVTCMRTGLEESIAMRLKSSNQDDMVQNAISSQKKQRDAQTHNVEVLKNRLGLNDITKTGQ